MRHARLLRGEELAVIDRETGALWPVQLRAAGMPFLAGNRVDLLIDGEATFTALFAALSAARHYIFLQFYIIRDDALGQRLADLLIARARAGVQIHVLYDDLGSSGLSRAYKRRLIEAGIEVCSFNRRHHVLRLFGPMRINYRNHRKNVVIDGRIAFTGGLNVGVEYLGQDPKFGAWRDTHVRVEGPAASSFSVIFQEDWLWATGDALELRTPPVEMPGECSVLLMATGPADRFEACPIAFTDLIGQAKQRLWIVSPYFVPDTDIRTALYAAALRGVDVRIMLPSRPDHLLVWLASNVHADLMVEHGVGIYRYTAGFLHEKVLLLDDRLASVGSVNFDNRSFAINFEMTLFMPHPRLVAEVEAMLEADFARSTQTTLDEVAHRPRLMRFISQAARLFSPVL